MMTFFHIHSLLDFVHEFINYLLLFLFSDVRSSLASVRSGGTNIDLSFALACIYLLMQYILSSTLPTLGLVLAQYIHGEC